MENQSEKNTSDKNKNKTPPNMASEETHEDLMATEESQSEEKEVNGDEDKANAKSKSSTNSNSGAPLEDSFKDKYYYLAAEMENYKRRVQREHDTLMKYSNEKILSDLIEVVDNFERTIDALRNDEDKKIQNIVVGIDMVKKQFFSTLQKFGLVTVEAVGKNFDPNFHEAVSQRNDDSKEEGEILEEYQKGYILNGRLLRASKVVVVSK
jgi:molecular chaperone GrpE